MLLRHWPCSQTCALFDQHDETALHISVNCCYAKEVWHLVSNWMGCSALIISGNVSDIKQWWKETLAALNGRQRRSVAAFLMYTTWHIWKERNRRIFQHLTLRPDQVFGLIQIDVTTRRRACGHPLLREEILAA